MDKNTFQWTGGLISTISGAAAGALTGALGPMIADPGDFNLVTPEGLHKILISAAVVSCGTVVVAFLNYLAKSPLPGWTNSVTTIEEKHTTTVTTEAVPTDRAPDAK